MISLKNVTKIFGTGDTAFTALKDVSFQVKDGESVAIVGRSGSGKSTLMHVTSGLDCVTSGIILIDGEDITSMKQKELDKLRGEKISFVFQSFFVQGNETCFDNVSLPLEINRVPLGKRKKMIAEALQAVELEDKIQEKAKNLSGGQKQRLAIARAIVDQPKILFADEPTGNLDTTTSAVIEKLLIDYNKKFGATLIIVTHNIDLAKKCDKQILIKDGQIVKIIEKGNKV
ncbi:MAG: ABC transporter ATP-binding protein [Candidatus Nanosyncoccaceae bacterium]|jgi:putative ABC transport system ATP-binding protein